MKFRKKPVVIDAVQFKGDVGVPEIMELGLCCGRDNDMDVLYIDTLEGQMKVRPTDWIIRGVANEIYPCRNDIFEATYEPAN